LLSVVVSLLSFYTTSGFQDIAFFELNS